MSMNEWSVVGGHRGVGGVYGEEVDGRFMIGIGEMDSRVLSISDDDKFSVFVTNGMVACRLVCIEIKPAIVIELPSQEIKHEELYRELMIAERVGRYYVWGLSDNKIHLFWIPLQYHNYSSLIISMFNRAGNFAAMRKVDHV